MAHFRGTIEGQRGQASRLGSKNSGLTVTAYGWPGGVTVSLYHNETTGQDMARVELRGHPSHGGELRRVLYDGPVHPEPFTPDYSGVVSLPKKTRRGPSKVLHNFVRTTDGTLLPVTVTEREGR